MLSKADFTQQTGVKSSLFKTDTSHHFSLEIEKISKVSHYRMFMISFKAYIVRLTILAYLVVTILTKSDVKPNLVFPLCVALNFLRTTIVAVLPRALVDLVEAHSTVKKIEKLLLLPQLKSEENSVKGSPQILMRNVTVQTIKDLSILIPPNELVGLVGPAGSGKSTLLNLILQELLPVKGTVQVHGTISYSAQEPWIFPGTIRDNILFGEDLNEERYKMIVQICALQSDFSRFAHGDLTLIGDKGVNLSGGQKARLNLARAVYRNSDIYLLDDPLSSVDPQVARHLFNECIAGFLKGKSVILITHQVHFLKNSHKIYVLEEGKLTGEGTFEELSSRNKLFLHLLNQETEGKENIEKGDFQVMKYQALDEVENHEEGVGDSYVGYFWKGNNCYFTITLLAMCVVLQIIGCFTDYMIIYWIESQVFSKNNFLQIYSGLLVLIILISLFRSWFFVKFISTVSKSIHKFLFNAILHTRMCFFNSERPSQILDRFSRDLSIIDEIIPILTLDSFQLFFSVLGMLGVISALNVYLIVPSILLIILLIIIGRIVVPANRSFNILEQKVRALPLNYFWSSLRGVVTIRAFNAEAKSIETFQELQDQHSSAYYMLMALTGAIRFWVDMTCCCYICYITFSFFVLDEMPVSYVGLAIFQASTITGLSAFTVKLWSDIDSCMVSIKRIFEFMKWEKEDEDGEMPGSFGGSLEFRNVTLKYPLSDSHVLSSVSFKVKPLEKIGIVGRTGAGKSSLISVLFRLFPFEGQVLIDDFDTKNLSLTHLRSSISIVPQEPIFFPESLRLNLDPLSSCKDAEIWKALEEVHLKDTVAGLPSGLATLISENGACFSVGQKQLLCLVRAMLKSSQILVLDEATASIDLRTDEVLQGVIRKRFKDCTVLTIAHRVSTVIDSDKILVLDGGKVVEFDHPFVLLQDQNGVFAKYVESVGRDVAKKMRLVAKENYMRRFETQYL